jgi:hypothetical protein
MTDASGVNEMVKRVQNVILDHPRPTSSKALSVAIIKAMREPTEAMSRIVRVAFIDADDAALVWQQMIDEALR